MEWEYAVMACRDPLTSKLETQLGAMGIQGWELITVWSDMFIFKRPR
jgi:hypothetical protein